MPPKDETGHQFERLTVIERAANNHRGDACWLCVCRCGTRVVVPGVALRAGHHRSCGCYQRDRARETLRSLERPTGWKHGDAPKHGAPYLYTTWSAMVSRCSNPRHHKWKNYGARGIQVAPEWRQYIAFRDYILSELGPRPDGCTLDRIDNDGNYEPGNVRWATWLQQAANRRKPQKRVTA